MMLISKHNPLRKPDPHGGIIAAVLFLLSILVLAACAPAPTPEVVLKTVVVTQEATMEVEEVIKTVEITATPVPTDTPTLTPTATPTLSPDQLLEEFKESQEYTQGFINYFEAMQLSPDDIEIREETIELNGQEYPMLVAVPDTSKLNETQQKYADLYQPVPIAIYAENRQTGEWEWMTEPPLRLFAQEIGLKIGNNTYFHSREEKANKLKHSNSLTITEPVIWYNWEPQKGRISSKYKRKADELVKTALENEMEITGHPIFDFGLYPDWLKEGNFSQEELEEIVRARVRSVMEPYKGKIDKWVVVNEFHPELVQKGWAEDYLYSRLGRRYVEIAFDEARKVDPNAILIYNDNANHTSESVFFQSNLNTIKLLKEKGLVDAIGLQMHINQNKWNVIPTLQQLIQTIKAFKNLGVDVFFTEVDMNISPKSNDGSIPFPEEDRFLSQGQVYRDILQTYLEGTQGQKHQVFTMWGIRDDQSWIGYIIKDGDGCIIDRYDNPKPAFYALLQVLYKMAAQGYKIELEN